jgi:hypothetical protein
MGQNVAQAKFIAKISGVASYSRLMWKDFPTVKNFCNRTTSDSCRTTLNPSAFPLY